MIDEYKSQKVKASSSFKIVSYQFGIVLINWSINLQFALKDTFITNDENIGNHGYIGTSILRIYRGYIGYIGDISADILEKNIDRLKIIKNS